jgi:hypothetical protein
VGDGDRLEGAQLDAAVGPVAGAVQHRHVTPRQAGAARQQGGLVGLDREQVVRMLLGHQELGCPGVGVEGVGGHDHAGQVERVQQRGEPRDFAGGAVGGALGQYRAGGVVHRGEQVELAAVGRLFGAAQGLAVDGDRPPVLAVTPVTVAQPGTNRRGQRLVVDPAQGAADGGLRGTVRWPVRGSRRAPSAERTGWGASAAHSAMAAIERAPASTAAAASPRTQASGWRQPAGLRGSGMVAR